MYWTMSSIWFSSSAVLPTEDFSHRSGGMSLGRGRSLILLENADDDDDDARFLCVATGFASPLPRLVELLVEDDRGRFWVEDVLRSPRCWDWLADPSGTRFFSRMLLFASLLGRAFPCLCAASLVLFALLVIVGDDVRWIVSLL